MSEKSPRLLDRNALRERGVTYSNWHISRLEKAGKFPQRVKFGARVFWVEDEVDAWIQERIAERDGAIANA